MKAPRPSPNQLRDRDSDAVRVSILTAARELAAELGPLKLTMRAIAAKVGMPTMTLYGYFPSKTVLVRNLWSLAFEPLFARLLETEARFSDPVDRLHGVTSEYVKYWVANPDLYRMVFLVEDIRERDDSFFIDQNDVVASYLRFGELISAAQGQQGRDRQEHAEALACALNGVAHMLVTVPEYPWRDSDVYVRLITNGIMS